MPRSTWLFTLAVVVISVPGQTADLDGLRQAVRLPSIQIPFGIRFGENGMELIGRDDPPADPAADISALRGSLKGDPEDADRYRRLAELYTAAGEPAQAAEAGDTAIRLYEQRLKDRPADAALLIRLSKAFESRQRYADAERVLRRAVRRRQKTRGRGRH